MKAYFALILALLLSACTQIPIYESSPKSSNQAVLDLMAQADTATHNGQYTQAKAKLERALRLEGNNPWLWLELARVNKYEGKNNEAKGLALRAKGLSADSNFLRQADHFINSL